MKKKRKNNRKNNRFYSVTEIFFDERGAYDFTVVTVPPGILTFEKSLICILHEGEYERWHTQY